MNYETGYLNYETGAFGNGVVWRPFIYHFAMGDQDRFAKSDHFDIRVNVGENNEHLAALEGKLNELWETNRLRYFHLTGVERGDNPNLHDVYGKRHVHVAVVFHNATSNNSVRMSLRLNKYGGYYCATRDKRKPISGWVAYHKKMRTKIDGEPALRMCRGNLPRDKRFLTDEQRAKEEDDRAMKGYRDWQRKKALIIAGDFDTLDMEFPGFQWSTHGHRMKSELIKQRTDEHCLPLEGPLENYIIWGPPGTGKSASVAYLYPRCYKKQKGTQFWDQYDRTNADHKVVWIDEMSVETLKTLCGKMDGGFEFLKELGDRYPVTVDAKYLPAQKIRPKTVVITMNEHPNSLLPDRATALNKAALHRKFRVLHIADWLSLHQLECVVGHGVRRIGGELLSDCVNFGALGSSLSPIEILDSDSGHDSDGSHTTIAETVDLNVDVSDAESEIVATPVTSKFDNKWINVRTSKKRKGSTSSHQRT